MVGWFGDEATKALHKRMAAELAPEDLGIQSLVNTLSYINALRSSNAPDGPSNWTRNPDSICCTNMMLS